MKNEIIDLLILNGRKPEDAKSGERVIYLYDAISVVNSEFAKAYQQTKEKIKLSYLFHEFIHQNEQNGIEDVIRETNTEVAGKDIDVQVIFDEGFGEKYFYKCMELAEKVIKSFETEDVEE